MLQYAQPSAVCNVSPLVPSAPPIQEGTDSAIGRHHSLLDSHRKSYHTVQYAAVLQQPVSYSMPPATPSTSSNTTSPMCVYTTSAFVNVSPAMAENVMLFWRIHFANFSFIMLLILILRHPSALVAWETCLQVWHHHWCQLHALFRLLRRDSISATHNGRINVYHAAVPAPHRLITCASWPARLLSALLLEPRL